MAQLLRVGEDWRGAWSVPQRFSLRVYVPAEDLDRRYQRLAPKALPPEQAGEHELTEQLSRLLSADGPALPPARDRLWMLPFSAAPQARALIEADEQPEHPVYHPPQRLRRSLHLVAAADRDQQLPLLPLLIRHDEVARSGEAVAPEHFLPLYARESDWTVPMPWYGLFAQQDLVRDPDSGAHRLIAPTRAAADRAAGAARVLAEVQRQEAQDLAADLRTTAEWVGSFSEGSLIVLHYGSLADTLQPDESPQDLEDVVELCRDGDLQTAEVAVRRIFRRWIPLAQRENAN